MKIKPFLNRIAQSIAKLFFLWMCSVTLLISFIVFDNFWEKWINKIWVNPIMSQFEGNEWWIVLLYSIILIAYYQNEYKKSETANKQRQKVIGISIILYFICFFSGKWNYTLIIKDYECTAWANILALIPLIGESILFLHLRNKKEGSQEPPKLEIEKTIDVSDSYGRHAFSESTYQILTSCFYKESSFALSITGVWGSGKTTFINDLKNKYKTNSAVSSIIDFEPWKNDTPDSIIRTFFTLLRNELRIYIPNISFVFDEYIQLLLDEESSKPLKIISKTLQKIAANQNPYESIKQSLEQTKHRIVVFIDDLDRLNAEEIKEVLRLIRNTANFPYMQFIVAYDKNYVCNILEHTGISTPAFYLEKFFNIEVALPKHEDRVVCQELMARFPKLINEIWGINENDDRISGVIYYCPVEPNNNIIDYCLVTKILHTVRDVIRFYNAYCLIAQSYKFQGIEKEIDFQDLFYIELLRYKYNHLYSFLCSKPFTFLELNSSNVFKLRNNINSIITELSHQNSEEVEIVLGILNYLFNLNKGMNSISDLRSYYKYFMFRLDGKVLTLDEFLSLADIEDDALLDNANKLYHNKYRLEFQNLLTEILNQIPSLRKDEHGEISASMDYHKIYGVIFKLSKTNIRAIKEEIAYAVIPHLEKFYCIDNTHFKSLLKLYDILDIDSKILQRFAIDNFFFSILMKENLAVKLRHEVTDEERDIVYDFLTNTTNPKATSAALTSFIRTIKGNNIASNQLLIGLSTLSDIQLHYFEQAEDKLSELGFSLFYNCQDFINTQIRRMVLRKEALEIMRQEILAKPENYFKHFIRTGYSSSPQFNTVSPEPFCAAIFGDYGKFEEFLSQCNSHTQYEERVKNYWELYKYNGYKPIEFSGQGNVQDKIDNNFRDEIKQLKELLFIKEQIGKGRFDKRLQNRFDANPLYIKLRGDIYSVINKLGHK